MSNQSTPPEPDWDDKPRTLAMPHSREAEEAVLGALIIDPSLFHDVDVVLEDQDFFIHRHRFVWQAIERLVKKKMAIDLVTISDEMDSVGQLAEAGGPAYLTALINQAPASFNIMSYAYVVEGHSIRRKMIKKANDIAALAYDEAKPIDDALVEYDRLVDHGGLASSGSDDAVGADLASLSLLEKISSGIPTGVLSGFPNFDDYEAFGAFPHGLTLLVGDSSWGKTAWCEQISEQVTFTGGKSLYFNFEDSNDAMVTRRVSGPASVDQRKIRSGQLTDVEQQAIADEVQKYQGRFGNPARLLFNTRARTLKELERSVRINVPDFVVVDQINQISHRVSSNKTENMIETVTTLKNIADKYGVAMLAVHAITSEESADFFKRNEKSQRKGADGQQNYQKNAMPDINAIAWATQLKYIADAMLFLVPEVNQKLVGVTEYLINIWIMKDRGGSRFVRTRWRYDLVMQWFEDLQMKSTQSAQVPSGVTP